MAVQGAAHRRGAQRETGWPRGCSGYRQRARFYTISDEGRLNFAKNIATYIVFLAENTGLTSAATCALFFTPSSTAYLPLLYSA